MAITNYTELQTAVASWLHRDVDQIVDFIALAEQHINAVLDSRVGELDASLTATISSRYIALPTGHIKPMSLWLTTYNPRREIRYIVPSSLPVTTTSSQPRYYTIDGSNIAFECPADIAYTFTFRYKKRYDIASTSTNDILTNYTGLYLYGALINSCMLTREESTRFENMYSALLDAFIAAESKNYSYATIQSDTIAHIESNIITGDY